MTVLTILKYPDPLLKQVAKPVTDFGSSLNELVHNMTETMYSAKGVGLAAPQVGVLLRVVVIDVSRNENDLKIFINPEIIDSSHNKTDSEEGCLSIPGYRETIKRFENVKVKAQNLQKEYFEVEAEELYAVCLQHEIDHLNGVLFIDHLSRLKKEFFKNWYKKNNDSTEQ